MKTSRNTGDEEGKRVPQATLLEEVLILGSARYQGKPEPERETFVSVASCEAFLILDFDYPLGNEICPLEWGPIGFQWTPCQAQDINRNKRQSGTRPTKQPTIEAAHRPRYWPFSPWVAGRLAARSLGQVYEKLCCFCGQGTLHGLGLISSPPI